MEKKYRNCTEFQCASLIQEKEVAKMNAKEMFEDLGYCYFIEHSEAYFAYYNNCENEYIAFYKDSKRIDIREPFLPCTLAKAIWKQIEELGWSQEVSNIKTFSDSGLTCCQSFPDGNFMYHTKDKKDLVYFDVNMKYCDTGTGMINPRIFKAIYLKMQELGWLTDE